MRLSLKLTKGNYIQNGEEKLTRSMGNLLLYLIQRGMDIMWVLFCRHKA